MFSKKFLSAIVIALIVVAFVAVSLLPGGNSMAAPGAAVLTSVSNANSNTGAWQIDGGTLRIGDPSSMGTGTSAVVINNTGRLELANITLDRDITLILELIRDLQRE